MGQAITVTISPSANENTQIFTLNRSLTGMENLTFVSGEEIGSSDNPAYVCAKRILEKGAETVSVYSNVITVGAPSTKLKEIEGDIIHILENLYLYYGEQAGWAPGSH